MKNNCFKKICAGISALSVCLSVTAAVVSADTVKGDADANGVVQALDIVTLKSHLMDIKPLSEEGALNADMNEDGTINVLDLVLLSNVFISGPSSETADSVKITLNGTEITADEGVTVDGTKVTITKSGNYTVTGAMTADSTITVAAAEDDKESVNITLDGVSMTNSSDTPCIMVENADKTKITFTGENTLVNTYDAADAASAVIYAKDDITFTKSSDGKLNIETNAQMGIYCNNDIKFNGGAIKIKTDAADTGTAKADAVKAKGNVELAGGEMKINAAGDGLKSSKAALTISGGTASIKSGKDALQGETEINITGGDTVACGDDAFNIATGTLTVSGGKIFASGSNDTFAAGSVNLSASGFVLEHLNDVHEKSETIVINEKEYTALKKFHYFFVYDAEVITLSENKVTVGGVPVADLVTSGGGGYIALSGFTNIQ